MKSLNEKLSETLNEMSQINGYNELPYSIKIFIRNNEGDKPKHMHVVVNGLDFRILFSTFDDPEIWNFKIGNESKLKNKRQILVAIKEWLNKDHHQLSLYKNREYIDSVWNDHNRKR